MLRRCVAVTTSLGALALLAAPAFVAPPPSASAADLAFPYDQSFATADGGVLSGDARILDGRLRLTDDATSKAGSWATTDTFPSTAGLEIEFDYAMYSTGPLAGADGLLLYLADGAAPAGVGATGAGLGYTCVKQATQGQGKCDVAGIPGGFAAFALDHYGNFSLPINDSGPGATPDSVVIRGSGNGVDGYRFVRGIPAPGGVVSSGTTPRKVAVTLLPGADGELSATVRVEAGGGMRTVLDRVPLHGDGQAPLPPTLRLGFAGATGSFAEVHEVDSLRVRQPADLRVEHDMPPVVAGERVSYTVTASNVGANASTPSPLTVDVPDQLSDVRWTSGDVTGTGDVATDLALDRGASATVTLEGTLEAGATGELSSTATIATAPHLADSDESDNTSTATAPVAASAELETDKTVTPGVDVHPGDRLEYTVTARNRGPSLARAVSVVDDLPEALTFVDSPDGCTAEGQRVTCGGDLDTDLAPDEERSFRFHADLDAEYRGDGSDVVNVATAESPTDADGGDPSPGVGIEVVEPDAPGDGGDGGDGDDDGGLLPGPTHSGGPTVAPVGNGGGAPGQGGALAYTGASDLGIVAAVGGALAAAGGVCWWVARRRVRASAHDVPVD
ncbi:DUF11 domain-containing protein [Curtobacterium sp. PhB136]|uniref:DUF11 domain-containing protein n=1 Tax=Curtobacterium sp. PhB136 TaxID=2485181 RepID=UPI001051DBA9|nr:DUF11 domain-containing protein [Curtobacterium sp. PhB136]TCK65526.1 putative repeat protein (TIGR01451 family) [Curtobacterium sp. PhB136]